jgi:hypothetical protein
MSPGAVHGYAPRPHVEVRCRHSHFDSNFKGTRNATSDVESVLAKDFGSASTEFIEFSVSGVTIELGPFRHATMEGISCP